MKEKHTYSSRLREEQTQRTREQILEALVKTMARGIATVSIPAVAREAGVSIPTVYRHFRTKRELIEAVGSYLVQKTGGDRKAPPRSPEELADLVKDLFALYEGADEMLRAAAMSQLAYEARKEVLPARLKMIEDALAPVKAHFAEADWTRLRNVVLVLFTTATVRAFKDYLDLSGEEAASCVSWAILTLARAASQTDQIPP